MHWREAQELWLLALASEGRAPDTLSSYKFHLVVFNRFLETTGIGQADAITAFHLRRFLTE